MAEQAEFWQLRDVGEALQSQHFGWFVRAYRNAHEPPLRQALLGRWLGMTQAQVSRLERAKVAPSDLRKLQRWASVLHVPSELLWFAVTHTCVESMNPAAVVKLEDVHRRDMLKVAGAAVVASTGVLTNAPWQRLAQSLAGQRAADPSTVTMIESRTTGFFRSEETLPARQLVASLKGHHRALLGLIDTTENDSLKRRLITAAGETEALAGWTFFDLQRPHDAVRLYRNALDSAERAGDNALAACVLGYWSYLLSAQENTSGAVRMLEDASSRVRGSAATTQAWISARLAEEKAAQGNSKGALQSLDNAMSVFDYANPMTERPWTCFFTPSRLGSLAVSTYSRLNHSGTDGLADTLIASLAPTENKVKALVMADLAMSAARGRDFDRVQALVARSAPLAVRTEASLAIDRLWDIVELLSDAPTGTGAQTRDQLTQQILATPQA